MSLRPAWPTQQDSVSMLPPPKENRLYIKGDKKRIEMFDYRNIN
jgi:hypothetical protein